MLVLGGLREKLGVVTLEVEAARVRELGRRALAVEVVEHLAEELLELHPVPAGVEDALEGLRHLHVPGAKSERASE